MRIALIAFRSLVGSPGTRKKSASLPRSTASRSPRRWLQALRMVLAEAVNDKYEYIEWWLYEATEDFKVWESDGSREWHLKEPEALYDYIVSECQG